MSIIDAMRGLFRQKTEPESAITRRLRIADEQDAQMVEQNMVQRPPDDERLIGSSDWIKRTGRRRRNREIREALAAGNKSWFQALEK